MSHIPHLPIYFSQLSDQDLDSGRDVKLCGLAQAQKFSGDSGRTVS
jgi:hypothetical protein